MGNSTGLGAVENLRVNSVATTNLNRSPINNHSIPSYTIKDFISFSNANLGDGNHDKAIIDIAFYKMRCPYAQLGLQSPQDLLDYIDHGEKSDLIIPLSSQQGGLSKFNNTNYPNVHTQSKNDPTLIDHVKLKSCNRIQVIIAYLTTQDFYRVRFHIELH